MSEYPTDNIKKYVETKMSYLKGRLKLEKKANKKILIRGQLDALSKIYKMFYE